MIRTLMNGMALSALLLAGSTALAAYPEHAVRMVAPMAAGGGTDSVARLFAKKLEARLGQAVIVENKPGAGGQLGVEHVRTAKPDGHTMLFTSSSALTLPYLRPMSFELQRDFVPVGQVGVGSFALVINKSLPFKTADEFLKAAKENPGKYTYGSAGVGSAGHLAGELLQEKAGISLVHVPFKSSGEISVALMGGQIDSSLDVLTVQRKHIEAGVVRGLATTGETRDPSVPDLPALNESKLIPGGYQMTYWFGMFLPSDTPKDVVARVRKEFAEVAKDPEVVQRVEAFALVPSKFTAAEFGQNIKEESAVWKKVIKDSGITLDK